jgi:probable HAF family extracellular repeat protein
MAGWTVGYANDLNNRGEVIGTMTLQGDQTHHGFLWAGGKLTNLGTLGGANSEAFWMNDAGDVVGRADFSPTDPHHHAFLWKNGVMTDLGTLGGYPNSTAYGVNNQDQVIGDYGGNHYCRHTGWSVTEEPPARVRTSERMSSSRIM